MRLSPARSTWRWHSTYVPSTYPALSTPLEGPLATIRGENCLRATLTYRMLGLFPPMDPGEPSRWYP